MRETFHGDLVQLGVELGGMCEHAATAMRRATRALLESDLALAEQVLAADSDLDERRDRCEEQANTLLALQAPVAGDLRAVLAAIHGAERIERMGDLAAHIAAHARIAHPARVVPTELHPAFSRMGQTAADMADRVGELVGGPAQGGHAELVAADEVLDGLHGEVLAHVTASTWGHGPAVAAGLALVARFFERFGDQAVSVATRLEFAATGELPRSG
ncbi:Phosphate transport system regulatory protein PhoU [Actinokineospora spheciospongiae]|uniref:Phosphate transport system regulatory protein PhoU n=1 Tax=Actinokineospora spheciospongiae TaxID=909613 RepID=W7JB05_9PSEU|nr:PhoU domain-containing protein [Actinokineospora spheciospongiae]EWC63224.1 Phosphate transport system regulatory protein PhoU [Actinokineospora spheciospongiae]